MFKGAFSTLLLFGCMVPVRGLAVPRDGASDVRVADVQMAASVSSDYRPIVASNLFKSSDTIHAVITTVARGEAHVTLGVAWRYFRNGREVVVQNDGRELDVLGKGNTVFYIRNPPGWPSGRYSLQVFLDGRPVRNVDFYVR